MYAPGDKVEFIYDGAPATVAWCSTDGHFVRVLDLRAWIPIGDIRPVTVLGEIPRERREDCMKAVVDRNNRK